jgi:hypothetical protein
VPGVTRNIGVHAAGAAMNFVFLPLSAQLLGLEAFALVGISATIQAWLFIFDGCNVFTRLFSRLGSPNGSYDRNAASTMFRAAERRYLALAAVGLALTLPVLGAIGIRQGTFLSGGSRGFLTAITLACCCAFVKLFASFYRGCLIGLGGIDRANSAALMSYTLRFPAPYLICIWQPDVRIFLGVQLFSFVFEAWLLRHRLALRRPLPSVGAGIQSAGMFFGERSFILNTFALAILATSSNYADKAILVSVLPLVQFGAASLSILLCSGVFVLATAIHQVYLPNMSKGGAIEAESFRSMMFVIAILAITVGVTVAVCADQIALIVTPHGSADLDSVALAMRLYGVGNCISIVSSGLYMNYFANGDLRRYRQILVAYLFVFTPVLVAACHYYYLLGAGVVWVVGNLGLCIALISDRLARKPELRVIWKILLSGAACSVGVTIACLTLTSHLDNAGTVPAVQVAIALIFNAALTVAILRGADRWATR